MILYIGYQKIADILRFKIEPTVRASPHRIHELKVTEKHDLFLLLLSFS